MDWSHSKQGVPFPEHSRPFPEHSHPFPIRNHTENPKLGPPQFSMHIHRQGCLQRSEVIFTGAGHEIQKSMILSGPGDQDVDIDQALAFIPDVAMWWLCRGAFLNPLVRAEGSPAPRPCTAPHSFNEPAIATAIVKLGSE